MSYDSMNFDENEIVLGEPTLTTDDIIELYENDEYITTVMVDTVLEALQDILDEDLDDSASVTEDGDEWIKAVSLRISAAALRKWVIENS